MSDRSAPSTTDLPSALGSAAFSSSTSNPMRSRAFGHSRLKAGRNGSIGTPNSTRTVAAVRSPTWAVNTIPRAPDRTVVSELTSASPDTVPDAWRAARTAVGSNRSFRSVAIRMLADLWAATASCR